MTKIILVNPVTRDRKKVLRVERCQQRALMTVGIWPPITLLEAATFLQYRGFNNIEIIDGEIEEFSFSGLAQEITLKRPDIIVLAVTTPTIEDDILFTTLLKKGLPDAVIIVTGLHATLFPRDLLKYDSIDYAVLGEPEETICDLADYLTKKRPSLVNIQGLGYKYKDRIMVNPRRPLKENYDYPRLPDRSLLKNEKYILPLAGRPFSVIKVSRGCDFRCSFCTSASYYGRGWKARSPENIVAEIRQIKEKYGIDTFLFLSDTFNARREFVIALTSLIIKENLNIQWVSNSRLDLADEQTVGLMKRAGCLLVSLGIESYASDILDRNNKSLRAEEIDRGIRIFEQGGIKTYGYFIFGLDGENKKSVFRTVVKACLSPLSFAHFYSLTPYPGTRYFARFKGRGWKEYFHGISNLVEYDHLNKKTINLYKCLAFIFFYLRPRRLILLTRYLLGRGLCY